MIAGQNEVCGLEDNPVQPRSIRSTPESGMRQG